MSIPAYAFLDLNHPVVAWAAMRGMMVSASGAALNDHTGFISFMLAGIIEYQNNPRLFNETIIEGLRKTRFPDKTSRLTGMYFFQTRSEAVARIGDPYWPSYFTQDNLVELELTPSSPITVVDANWITFAELRSDSRIRPDCTDWIARYWSGESYNASPVWEVIADGEAIIRDAATRRRCFDLVNKVFPKAIVFATMAHMAGQQGLHTGLSTPFLHQENDNVIRLKYLFRDFEFHSPECIAKLLEHPSSGYLRYLVATNEVWFLPDFQPWFRTFQLGTQQFTPDDTKLLQSIHHVRNCPSIPSSTSSHGG